VLHDQHDVRGLLPPTWTARACAVGRSELRSRPWIDQHDAGLLEVPRRLDDAGEHDLHRSVDDRGRELLRGLRRRHLHPAGRRAQQLDSLGEPADVPPRVPQLSGP